MDGIQNDVTLCGVGSSTRGPNFEAGWEIGQTFATQLCVTIRSALDIHWPTDATLLWDSVRVLTRLDGQLREIVPAVSDDCPGGVISRRDGAAIPLRATQAFKLKAQSLGVDDGAHQTGITAGGMRPSTALAAISLMASP